MVFIYNLNKFSVYFSTLLQIFHFLFGLFVDSHELILEVVKFFTREQ